MMEGGKEILNKKRPDATPILELPNIEAWFEEICEAALIEDPIAVFSQIETWIKDGTLLPDILPTYKHATALKTFLSRVTQAAQQAIQNPFNTSDPTLFYRLQRSSTYTKLFRLDSAAAKSILVFACSRPKASNRIEERLEVEMGRFAVHNFQRTPDNYFFRQGSDDFQHQVRKSNGILKNGTDQSPTNHQHEIIQRRTLKQIGALLLRLKSTNYDEAKTVFEERLPNDLTLQNYATCTAQLETFCPETYRYCADLIAQSTEDGRAVNGLYFLGTVMRTLYQAIKTSGQVSQLSNEGEDVALQHKLNDTLVRERLSSAYKPKTQREENQRLWTKIQELQTQSQSPELIFQTLNDQEKKMLAQEKLRALARSCGIEPQVERLI